MTRISVIHKSGKITGRYDYRRGFIKTPYSQLHHTFVRMYEIHNKWFHKFLPHKNIRVLIPIQEFDPGKAFNKDAEILDFIAARTKYRANVSSWVYFDLEAQEFQKWIEIRFQSKRDAMLVKLAWI